MRKQQKDDVEEAGAEIVIEKDSLVIIAGESTSRLPKSVVDQLVSSLVISGFGPQTAAEFNTVLMFRDLKMEQKNLTHTPKHIG